MRGKPWWNPIRSNINAINARNLGFWSVSAAIKFGFRAA